MNKLSLFEHVSFFAISSFFYELKPNDNKNNNTKLSYK
jgi:hypothetical protein